ncbi:hypothetical protein [Gloeobacter violaceus]|uniref:Glr2712 protein n=1 Tax=Gloeobacter violaceus (strain ATCC 29082 / PCC 7421) TaxID=251221 RepID=Q7NH25_GLOVI|nr:hypothetical protein [Gloeobacter violaceus]BAC90653.1 glr2712 [Gloeobacter violaceus PCC 7421]
MSEPLDIVLLSNGPGELNTWVRPVVAELVRRWPQARLSVILAPDGNSSGKEEQMALSIPGVARVQPARAYGRFLLTGRTAAGWDWSRRGLVLFLGGDQGLSVIVARRLGYPIVAYAEWQARWTRFIDRFGLREEQVRARSGRERFAGQFQVVGDLMIDAARSTGAGGRLQVRRALGLDDAAQLLALLPGSKPAKLSMGIPLMLGIVEGLARRRPGLHFVLPVAPGLAAADLERFARPGNPDLSLVEGLSGRLVRDQGGVEYLQSPGGAQVRLWFERPAYDLLAQSDLALTTVGANTAELGILGVPMIVIIPTNRLDAMRAWDGVPGLLSGLPGRLGASIAAAINKRLVGRLGLLAWPNIRAGRMLVPELCRRLCPGDLLPIVEEWLDDPARRRAVACELRQAMGPDGAARAFVDLAAATLAGSQPA